MNDIIIYSLSIESLTTMSSFTPVSNSNIQKNTDNIQNNRLKYADGSIYIGETRAELITSRIMPHGFGKEETFDGDIYEGQWKNGKFWGHGKATLKNGVTIEGEFQDGMLNGFAVRKTVRGVYKGRYKNGIRDGFGTYTWNNGSCYKGFWENNMQSGEGQMTFENGQIYKGIFKNGVYHGKSISS